MDIYQRLFRHLGGTSDAVTEASNRQLTERTKKRLATLNALIYRQSVFTGIMEAIRAGFPETAWTSEAACTVLAHRPYRTSPAYKGRRFLQLDAATGFVDPSLLAPTKAMRFTEPSPTDGKQQSSWVTLTAQESAERIVQAFPNHVSIGSLDEHAAHTVCPHCRANALLYLRHWRGYENDHWQTDLGFVCMHCRETGDIARANGELPVRRPVEASFFPTPSL